MRKIIIILFLMNISLLYGQPTEAQRVRQLFDNIRQSYQTNDMDLINQIASSALEYDFWREAIVSRASGIPTDDLLRQRVASLFWLYFKVADSSKEFRTVFNRLVAANQELNRSRLLSDSTPRNLESFWQLLSRANITEEERSSLLRRLFNNGSIRQDRRDYQFERGFWKQALLQGGFTEFFTFTGLISARLETMIRFLLRSQNHADFTEEHTQLLSHLVNLQYRHRNISNISKVGDL